MRKTLLLVIAAGCVAAALPLAGCQTNVERTPLVVLHAGSLSGPFAELETRFEAAHPDVDVQLEGAGSAATIRKVTDQGKLADVVASADYALIPRLMIPNYTDFYVKFANNQIIIAYTNLSRYRTELTADNWYTILQRPDVRFGFSNPNDDPCGYRSLMLVQLAALHYGRPTLFDDLIASNSAYTMVQSGNNYTIRAPTDPAPDTSKLMIRSAEVDLMAALEAGEIDYLFIYRSVAVQHSASGVAFLELPAQVNLGDPSQAGFYGRVSLTQFADSTNVSKMVNVTASPIVYGVTIPNNAPHRDMAIAFLEMLLGEEGQQVFAEQGQPPIVPPLVNNMTALPAGLQALCAAG